MYSAYQGGNSAGIVIKKAESESEALKKLSEWFEQNNYEVIELTDTHVLIRFMGSIARYTVKKITIVI
jgi:hypothetical protein